MALLSPFGRAWRSAFATALAVACPLAHADRASESDVKTAFAYNFVALTSWPAETPAVLRFCVAGPGSGALAFGLLAGKAAGERTIAVTHVASPDRVADCQALYVPPSENARFDAWIAAASRSPTLTIGDQSPPGAIVTLRLAAGRLVFDVDARAAAGAKLLLSSQLLKLAAVRR
ncbi:hypothetical protein BWI17_18645 [Betaproteobacteria bacterium GR16-43]|nr:hypothetical protein BWI17_18645 [Betaproteobacteria bacterium GR16-43]